MFNLLWICVAFITLTLAFPHGVSVAAEVQVLDAKPQSAGLREKIILTIENLPTLAKESQERHEPIIPFLDGLPLVDGETYQIDEQTLEVILRRSDTSKGVWNTLLKQRDGFFASRVALSVGFEKAMPIPTAVRQFQLIFINKTWFMVCVVAVLLLAVLFVYLAVKTNLIRDLGPNPDGEDMKPYSIGRTQMAFWFFLVIASYPFIWLITGELGTITGSILGLMGISAGTALGSTMIDVSKHTSTVSQQTKLHAEKKMLLERMTELEGSLHSTPAPATLFTLQTELEKKKARLDEVMQLLDKMIPFGKGRPAKHFLEDILSDGTGMSLHRFQIFAWTIVLGIIFLAEVYENLRMPEFNETLLALMGISSGTYLGFKFPEQHSVV